MGKIKKAIIEGALLERIHQTIWGKVKRFFTNIRNGKYRKAVYRRIDNFFASFARRKLANETSIDENKILIITSRGSYNCNPKAVVDEIIRQKLPWKLVWVARMEDLAETEQYPEKLRLVTRDSIDFYKEMASAKVWIDNSVNLSYMYLPKKPEQVLIEIWHGSFGLKRFDTSSDKVWIRKARQAGARTDYCVTNSDFEARLLQESFWGTSEILPYGHPRNDALLLPDTPRGKEIAEKMRDLLGLAPDTKVALYAPTFRDNRNLSYYNINYKALHKALTQRFGGKWVILTRFHFELRKVVRKAKIEFPGFVIDVTSYEDIQDILSITDVGITDYSSWVCDFVLTKKPVFLFVTDYKTFNGERGFCYPLESTPFPLAEGNQGLIDRIRNFDEKAYQKKCDEYLAAMGCVEDGHAAEKVVEKLKEIMGYKETSK